MKILIVEDDVETATYITNGLSQLGHVVDHVACGRDGLLMATGESYAAMVVDRMLPGIDGLSLVRAARAAGVATPAIFLTTMASIGDRVEGLEAGGDDYLVKPFAFQELLARLNALARRPPLAAVTTALVAGDVDLDLVKRRVTRRGREIELQPKEFKLLECLMRNCGRVTTRTMLLEQVWDFHFDPRTNVVETHISRLRSKLNRGFETDPIRTIRGSGYVLDAHHR